MKVITYISRIEKFLKKESIISNTDIEILIRRSSKGKIIGINIKNKSTIDFKEGKTLILNFEKGHVLVQTVRVR